MAHPGAAFSSHPPPSVGGVAVSTANQPMEPTENLSSQPPAPDRSLTEPDIERLRLKLRYKVLYHLGHACAEVDDLVQETLARFIRAEQRRQIRNTEEFGAFLNGVCRNVILEYRRRVRREPNVDPALPVPDAGVRPDAEILELRDAIDHGLEELGERDREILSSLYLEGREKDEICRQWGMTDAQFRVVLFRAKERFRRAWGAQHVTNRQDDSLGNGRKHGV